MERKLELGKNILEFILGNMFIYLVIYYSILIWSFFQRKEIENYKYVIEVKNLLFSYNSLILFTSLVCIIITIMIRILFYDHSIGIKDDDDSKAILYLHNANKLEKIGSMLFLTIIPISLYDNLNSTGLYLFLSAICILIIAAMSKIVLLIKNKIKNIIEGND